MTHSTRQNEQPTQPHKNAAILVVGHYHSNRGISVSFTFVALINLLISGALGSLTGNGNGTLSILGRNCTCIVHVGCLYSRVNDDGGTSRRPGCVERSNELLTNHKSYILRHRLDTSGVWYANDL